VRGFPRVLSFHRLNIGPLGGSHSIRILSFQRLVIIGSATYPYLGSRSFAGVTIGPELPIVLWRPCGSLGRYRCRGSRWLSGSLYLGRAETRGRDKQCKQRRAVGCPGTAGMPSGPPYFLTWTERFSWVVEHDGATLAVTITEYLLLERSLRFRITSSTVTLFGAFFLLTMLFSRSGSEQFLKMNS
jgi:hypothetical protein